jgi:two-component system phosphate regulon sensor histidine kinase PhoR
VRGLSCSVKCSYDLSLSSTSAPKTPNLTGRIFLKLIVAVLCVLAAALTAVDLLASKVAHKTYVDTLTRHLEDKARILSTAYSTDATRMGNRKLLDQLAGYVNGRISIIDREGRVEVDSEANVNRMENHSSRPEIARALAGGIGSDARLSSTVGVRFLYVAVPFRDGVLRIAVPLRAVDGQVEVVRNQLLAGVAFAFIPAILLAAIFAQSVSAKLAAIIAYAGKLARGEFDARLKQRGRDELGILAQQLNETGEKLQTMFEELQHEHAELEKLERIRKDFVINVSHEIRTPLASIQGYTETLLEGALHEPEHNTRFLGIIRQNAERLGRLTADLMTLSRLEHKRTRFQFASYYANQLMGDCVDSMMPIAEKKNIDIQLKLVGSEVEVFCDSEAVHQVMTNLMDNALKYTPENGSISVGAAQRSSDRVEFYVRDTGIGISKEELPRLFERFYRVDKARSRELGGTGLGLAIVKHLVRAQGGDVRVESEVGVGSTFYFSLPVHDLSLDESGAPQPELTNGSQS